jgi:hypothetical protein
LKITNREEFKSKLPGTIQHCGYGESHLKIVEDYKFCKTACNYNKETSKVHTDLAIPGTLNFQSGS